MVREGRGRVQVAREVGRALQVFSRVARARRLYRSNNVVVQRMMGDLTSTFDTLLQELGDLSLKFRPESILFDDEVVFEEPNPDESIPFVFYRDGVRRLDLSQGISREELEILISATADGYAYSGLGDDIVSFLWRHDLEHVRYMVVDTTIVSAVGSAANTGAGEAFDLDAQIDGLLASIYGAPTTDDVGPRSVRVDVSDISAKAIAETLDSVDEMAPGFHPPRMILDVPSYAQELRSELEGVSDDAISMKVLEEGLQALRVRLEDRDADAICESLLRMYDGALVAGSFGLAGHIIRGMRTLGASGAARRRVRAWVEEAVAEARLRQVSSALQTTETEEAARGIFAFFEACGPTAVPSILGLIPSIPDPQRRRAVADAAARVGIDDLEPLRALLASEQAFVAIEGVHVLSTIDSSAARELLLTASGHPQAPVRVALLSAVDHLPKAHQLSLGLDLLADPDAEVATAAASLLGRMRDISAVRAVETRVKGPEIHAAPANVKQALLRAYVQLVQVRALPVLAKMFHDGGGLLAKKDAEDLAIAAAQALADLGTPGAIAALQKAAKFLNLRVREAANDALRRVRRRE